MEHATSGGSTCAATRDSAEAWMKCRLAQSRFGGEAAAPPPPPLPRPPEVRRQLRGKQPVVNEEVRRGRGGASLERRAADAAEERSGPRVHRGRVVHAQGPRGEIRQRAPRYCSRRTTDSDMRSCTTTSTAAWAGERTCPYCNKVFSFAMHRFYCSAAPYEVWHEHLMKKRARSAPPAVIASWTDECPHCKITFGSERAI